MGVRIAGEVQLHGEEHAAQGTEHEQRSLCHQAEAPEKGEERQRHHQLRAVAEQAVDHQYFEAHHHRLEQELAHHMGVDGGGEAEQQHGVDAEEGPVVPAHQLAEEQPQGAAAGQAQALAQVVLAEGALAVHRLSTRSAGC
ncbi:hypothetical protein FQZ97_497240 [compost metagenome]